MDVIAAYRDVGSYRGAAAICGTTHKTASRIVEAHEAASRGEAPALREPRPRNYDEVAELVAEKVEKTAGRISAKRLLPAARAAGYAGSDRNFRRLVAQAKREWRAGRARAGGRRPAVWTRVAVSVLVFLLVIRRRLRWASRVLVHGPPAAGDSEPRRCPLHSRGWFWLGHPGRTRPPAASTTSSKPEQELQLI